jgi:hypothetical protein
MPPAKRRVPRAVEPETSSRSGHRSGIDRAWTGYAPRMLLRPLLLLLAAFLVAGCGGSEADVQAETTGGPMASSGSASDLSGTGLDGEALEVADFAGKPVFVNVWSSW